ncbi:CpaF family protein [Brachybacterium sp. AOP25-B2-12]|uniref:CpaF family protein n=1 Tax=Brachybacterium sp. AOP25-B2-12 TaxID=3457710 RepID=UPI004034AFC1
MNSTPSPTTMPDFASMPLVELDDDTTATLDFAPAVPSRRTHRNPTPTPATPAPATGSQQRFTDWKIVTELRSLVSDALSKEDRLGQPIEDQKAQSISLITHLIDDQERDRINEGLPRWTGEERRALNQAVLEAVFGFGRLQPLLDDDTIENIELYGHEKVIVQRTGHQFEEVAPIADSDEELLSMLAHYAHQANRNFDPAHPNLELSLGSTARLEATGWVVPKPIATIRIHRLIDITLNDLVELDLMPVELADFLRAAVRAKKSMMVAGDRGAGKTTLLRALINEIDAAEKIGTIESIYELHLELLGAGRHPRLVQWEAVPGSSEKDAAGRPIGEITMDYWAQRSFRHNLDRLIVGELLGTEVIAMFEAMQTGAGSMSTVHAKSAAAVPERIVTLARKDGRVTEDFARRQVAENIDLAIYVGVVPLGERDPWTGVAPRGRRITNVTTYSPGEDGRVASTQLWEYSNGQIREQLAAPFADDLIPHLAKKTPRSQS